MKIVLITRDRPELTRQTIETMKSNALNWDKHKLVVVFDGTRSDSNEFLRTIRDLNIDFWHTGNRLGVGGAKNAGTGLSALNFQPDDVLMLSDNDMYYLPGWDEILEHVLKNYGGLVSITQLGGWKHPFHAFSGSGYHDPKDPTDSDGIAYNVDAATGNCFVIRYKDWLKYGPFDSNAIGPGQSEDYAFSQRIIKDGGIVATLDPPVAIHCGLANCEGKPATGWEEMAQMAQKQIEDYKIDKIWLSTPDEGIILLERLSKWIVPRVEKSVEEIRKMYPIQFKGINCGSGQRRFDNNLGWTNVDIVSRPPDQVPDILCDATKLDTKFAENSQDMVVLHHVIEHFGCGEADEVLKQCYKVLKPGGSLLIFVPDLRKLAGRWLSGELDDFSFLVNIYGAYQGLEGDRHKWGFDRNYLIDTINKALWGGQYDCGDYYGCTCQPLIDFDWREIPGADIARDWWVLAVEVIK